MDFMTAAALSITIARSRIMVKKSPSVHVLDHSLLIQPASTAPTVIIVSRQFQSDVVALMGMAMWDLLGAFANAVPRDTPGVETAAQGPSPPRRRVSLLQQAVACADGRGLRAPMRWS